jgi:hypothetical protein
MTGRSLKRRSAFLWRANITPRQDLQIDILRGQLGPMAIPEFESPPPFRKARVENGWEKATAKGPKGR